MITEKKKRRLRPYLLLGIGLFYLFHWFFKLWLLAPDTDSVTDIFGLGKLNWMSDHLNDKSWFDFQFTPASLLIGMGGFLIAFLLYLRVSDTGTYRYGEEHGSARFATREELMRFRDEEPEKNMIFTQNSQMGLFNNRLSFENQINKNILVYGGTGDSKTRSAVKPNILQANSSFVTTDTKGILIHETGKSLVEKGYKMKIFDLITFLNSDGFNVFRYIHNEMDIDRVAEAITESLNRNGHESDPFWPAANKLLMRSLIGYLYFDAQLDHYLPNLGQVTDMIRELRRNHPEAESPVELMFEDLERRSPGNYACRQWELFNKNFDGQTRASVYAIFATTFSVFDHEQLRKIIEKDTLEIEKWNIEKTAVFIHIPEVDPAYQFLSALLFSTIFDVLIKTADAVILGEHPTKAKEDLLHLQVWADEFGQIGKIPNLPPIISVIRSREISIKMMVQSQSQIEVLYGKENTKTIINNCGAILYLGSNDLDTLKYLSERSGKQTLNDQNYSESRGRNASSSKQNSKIGRELLTPHEVATIGTTEALLFLSKQNVFRDQKFNLDTHPRAYLLSNGPTDENWYRYKRYLSDIDEWKAQVGEENVIHIGIKEVEEVPLKVS